MRLEELKNDIPETPEFIHQMICKEVDKQIHSSNIVELSKKKKSRWENELCVSVDS